MKPDGLHPGWAVGIALLALALIVAAHVPMQEHRMPAGAIAALAAGVILWVVFAIRFPPPSEVSSPLEPPSGGPRLLLLLPSVVFATLTWADSAGGTYRLRGVAAWLAAAVFWVLAWRSRRPPRADAVVPTREAHRRPTLVAALLGVMLVGAGFLFYRLSETPANPTSDHAEKLLDVLDLVNGERPIFFIRNTGREPFQFYWTFLLMKVFGLPPRYLTLKIGTAIIGLLFLPALYLLGRELGGTPLGLSAAALAAWGKWPVALARQGLRYTLAVLPTALVLWSLLRYLRRGDRASLLWAGVVIGLGLHGYISFRTVPLLVPLVLGFTFLDPRRRGRRTAVVGDGLLIMVTAVIFALPLLHYTVEHPEQFWERAATRVTSLEVPVGAAPLAIFGHNVLHMLVAFDWRGASTWVVMQPYEPFLDAVTGAFLIAGVVLVLVRIFRGSSRWAIVALSFFLLTLPSTLSLAFPAENPSVNRSGTVIPVIFLVAALPVVDLVARRQSRGASVAAGVGLAALLAFSVYGNYRDYLVDFHRSYDKAVDHSLAMAHVLDGYRRSGVPVTQMYLLAVDYGVDGRNIALEMGEPFWAPDHILLPAAPLPRFRARPLVFLFTPGAPNLAILRRFYPGGTERIVHQSFADRDFGVYFVPR